MKCETPRKGEQNDWVFKHNPCIKSLKNTTICFSMVDLLCKFLMLTQIITFQGPRIQFLAWLRRWTRWTVCLYRYFRYTEIYKNKINTKLNKKKTEIYFRICSKNLHMVLSWTKNPVLALCSSNPDYCIFLKKLSLV